MIHKLILLFSYIYICTACPVNDTYYPRYHLAPCGGWMNDPNGFSVYEGMFNLFFQYNPKTSQEPGIAHWGHARSRDLFNWKHLPIALYPNSSYDKTGVFSGSAIVEDNKIYAFYTGNVNHPDETPNQEQQQALAVSADGINFVKYSSNPIIQGEEYQPNIRDPKVWKHNDKYYMVLGNSFNNNTLGRVLLYESNDKIVWTQVSILDESDGYLGYMWECPDFIELNGKHILFFSPQGMQPEGDKFKNLYQTGYIIGNFDYDTLIFTPTSKFKELDHGHDFYATQSISYNGRRMLVAWFDMWEKDYPERDTGFTGCITIPRELTLTSDGVLLQKPVEEIEVAIGRNLFSGKGEPGKIVELDDKTGEINIKTPGLTNLEIFIESDTQTVVLVYDYKSGNVTLDRGGNDGVRRTNWKPMYQIIWRIFIDASTVELFCGDGEVTFSSRFFPNSQVRVRIGNNVTIEEFTVNAMKRTMPNPETCCTNTD